MTKQIILNRLNEITKASNFINILSKIVIRDFCGPIDILFSHNNMEHLNHKEFSFLIGLWIKNFDANIKYEKSFEMKIFNEVYNLMEKLHHTFLEDFKFRENNKPDLYKHFMNGNIFQETMFYSGTGAYDNQYKKFCTDKYDNDWLLENRKFEIGDLPNFFDNLKNILQEKINSRVSRKHLPEEEQILSLFCLKKDEIINKNPIFLNVLNSLSVDIKETNNKKLNQLGDFNIFSEKPIIKIEENLYFIPSAFAVSESIYESPYYWMLSDKKYEKTAFHNRGKVAEEITKNILNPVFGSENVYQNIIINKSKNNQITDIDILAIHFHKAIIFQVKSKKLTALSKNGDIESIKNDFKKAVQDAFEQGLVCKNCLINYSDFKFKNQDEAFTEKISKILEFYIVTIVLDDYPALVHQVHILLGNKTDELPVALNVFDLEMLAKYLPNPEKFIDYISRRTKYSKAYKSDNEMGYLGFHLNQGLQKPKADYIALDATWAQSIDRKYYNELYNKKNENLIQKKIQRNDPCFCLSGLKYKKCHGK